MTRRILIINGHPDCRPERLCTALANSYAAGAESAGHEVQRLDLAAVSFPLLNRAEDFMTPPDQPDIARAQALCTWAQDQAGAPEVARRRRHRSGEAS